MMRQILNLFLPAPVIFFVKCARDMRGWVRRGFLENAPQFVKQNLFLKYGIPNTPWVETGTFMGESTDFFSRHFGKVYSIEPAPALYQRALRLFAGRDVVLFNDVSEAVLPTLLPTLSGDLNFWLDGHYSAGITFLGNQECPVREELKAIEDNLANLQRLCILIDDMRCFLPFNAEYPGYPTIDELVDWARAHGFNWRIEQDIMILRNFI
jgi:hypothetical protein